MLKIEVIHVITNRHFFIIIKNRFLCFIMKFDLYIYAFFSDINTFLMDTFLDLLRCKQENMFLSVYLHLSFVEHF